MSDINGNYRTFALRVVLLATFSWCITACEVASESLRAVKSEKSSENASYTENHSGLHWELVSEGKNDRFHRVVFRDKVHRIFNFQIVARDPNADFTVETTEDFKVYKMVTKIDHSIDDTFYYHRVAATEDKLFQVLYKDRARYTKDISKSNFLITSSDGSNWQTTFEPFVGTKCKISNRPVGFSKLVSFQGNVYLICNQTDGHHVIRSSGSAFVDVATLPVPPIERYVGAAHLRLAATNSHIYCNVNDNWNEDSGVLLRSGNGKDWEELGPADSVRVVFSYGDALWGFDKKQFYRSDFGKNWQPLALPDSFSTTREEGKQKEFDLTDGFPVVYRGSIYMSVTGHDGVETLSWNLVPAIWKTTAP